MKDFIEKNNIKRSQIRSFVLKKLLNLAGFKIIREHWVYSKDLDKESIIIDLGANTGSFSEKLINEYNCKIFAIEPNRELFNNIKLLNLTKLNYAVSKYDEPVELFLSENDEASSIISNFQNLWETREKCIVAGISWESLKKKINLENSTIDLLKIDVEGAELDFFENFQSNDVPNVKQITVEFHHKLNSALHDRTVISIKKLLSLGYTGFANQITPTEILFLNIRLFKFNIFQKFVLKIYHRLSFSLFPNN